MPAISSTTDVKDNPNHNKILCDGFECYSTPSQKIKLDCGTYGSLIISVCERCSSKFASAEKERVSPEIGTDSKDLCKKDQAYISGNFESNEKRVEIIPSTNIINSPTPTSKNSKIDLHNKMRNLRTGEPAKVEFY